MNVWAEILKDPVVWGSILGIAIVIGLCSYYVWYFMSHLHDAERELESK
ncbi:hypothetical protein C2869_19335 [Saccharobesus litoralis]|uniref:DUF3149 domain-containing protein n=1 Tax=Saccharobesus litoralis TaxID=2172099 RepID=A0A2S0VW31_9ALTE|nr:DUF3149 domain-containing protein [Saccharobesus litoralis]AWB68427.1 hypothetical protein C2869_19335 [Saccharobesus litoralis]